MFNAVVAVFRFNDDFHIFVNLFLLAVAADGLNQIAALQNFVQHPFAEHFVPAAGAACGNTADDHTLAGAAAVLRGGSIILRKRRRHSYLVFLRRRGGSVHPFYKRRVIGRIVTEDIGAFPVNVNAGRNQVGKQVVELHNTAFFGVVRSQNLDVLFVGKRAGGQSGKNAFGAAFYKQAHAGIVGGFELFNPFHGVGNLRDHKVFNFLGVIGIEFRRDVGGNGHLGRVERKRIQEGAVLRHSRTHNFGMESVRDRNLHGLNAHIGKHLDGFVYSFGSAGDNRLRRAVFVGYGHITVNAFKMRFHGFGGSGDRSHFAVVFHFNFRHHFAAGAHGFKTVFKIKNTGGYGSGIFTQAVPHHHIRLQPEGRKQTHHCNIGRKHSGLRHFGFLNGSFAGGNLFFGFARFAP